MKTTHKEQLYIRQDALSDQLFDTSSIFFDIETTGFSPSRSCIYLIGCVRHVGEMLVIDQFLAEKPAEEIDVLNAFLNILKDYNTIISFNGIGFDIPFIKAKCTQYHIADTLKDYQYLDIFKSVSEFKFLLKLPNYKQKSIEEFLGLHRDDIYSGGELITVYEEYVKNHSSECEELLLLHNYDDVTKMLDLLPILSYIELFHGQYSITETKIGTYRAIDGTNQKELLITLALDYPVPKRVSYQYKEFYLIIREQKANIRIPVYTGELHYFYSNYRDYYYLPQEDMAVHKSVASYVDKCFRENAKASNCYTRKESEFLPQMETIMNPEFKKEYKDKLSYFEVTEDFCRSDIMLRRYVDHILSSMLKVKPK